MSNEPESTKPEPTTTGSIRDSLHATSVCIIGLFTIAAVAAIYILKPVLLPIVLAMLIAAALHPVVEKLHRIGMPRTVVAGIVLAVFVVSVVFSIWNFADPVSRWVSRVPGQLDRVDAAWQELRRPVDEVAQQVDELSEGEKQPYEPTVAIEEEKLSQTLFASGLRGTGSFFLTIVTLYFTIGYGHHITARLRRDMANDLVGEIVDSVSTYLFTITLINAGLGVAIGVAMWLVGMPDPIIWGLLAFILNFLPYIGAVVGVGLTGFVAMITFDTLTWRLIPPGAYLLLTVFEANFVTPTILGRRLPINPLVLFVWVIFWGWLWGVAGALLAVPLLVALRLSATHFRRLEFIGEIIGPTPDVVRNVRDPDKDKDKDEAKEEPPKSGKPSAWHLFGRS